jgi:hypothetical protein
MFCAPGLFFGGTEGVRSRFHVLRSRTRCQRYRGRRASFSCFALPYSVSAVPRASGSVLNVCAPELDFDGTDGRRVPFSCFVLPDPFSAVPAASGSVFMFCALGLVFSGTEGIGSNFHVFRSRTPFSTVPTASGAVFMFCAPRLDFGGTEGVQSRFLVLRSRTRFLRYRRRRFPFSCFALPDPFWAVPMASGPIFMFCAPGRIFGGTEAVGSRFRVLRSMIRFRRYQGFRVPFSCFALPDPFWAVPMASGPIFMFCAPGRIFGGTEAVWSRFRVLRSLIRFRRYQGCRVPFSCFALPDPFSTVPTTFGPDFMFCAPDSFSAVSRALSLFFMFCAPGPVFVRVERVGSHFHVLRYRTHFRR